MLLLFVRSFVLGRWLGGTQQDAIALGCSYSVPLSNCQSSNSVTKALLMCFEILVNSEAFINKIRSTVAIIHC